MEARDQRAVFDAARALATRLYPELRFDAERALAAIREAQGSSAHYARVVDRGAGAEGALLAIVNDNLWAQRRSAGVSLWYSDAPGGGVALLRDFVDWLKPRRAVRVAGFAVDAELDPGVWRLVEAAGFKKRGGTYLLFN